MRLRERMNPGGLWGCNVAFAHLSSYQLASAIVFVTVKVTHHSDSHVVAVA